VRDWPVPVPPSPKFHEKVYGAVPPEALPVKSQVNGTEPVSGVPVALAVTKVPEPQLPVTDIVLSETVELCPLASVTVRLGWKDPGQVYWWLGFCEVLVFPSPKFQLYEYGEVPPAAVPVNDTLSGAAPPLVLSVAVAPKMETESEAVGGC
jgi:hypothetical protein